MNWPYALALIISALISAAGAAAAWQRRSAPGASGLSFAMLAFATWALTYAVRWMAAAPAAQYFWLDATYLGVASGPSALLIFALQFTQRSHLLTRRNLILLAVEPVLTLLILVTDPLHGLFYAGLRSTGTILNGGPWFWVNVVYSYCLFILVLGLFAEEFLRSPRFYRQQTGTLLIGMLLPFLGNTISLARLSPFPGLDITPFVFGFSGLVFSLGLYRYHPLDIVPIARDKLVESMSDGVIVLDIQQRIVDLNPAAQGILGVSRSWIGKTADSTLGRWPGLDELLLTPREDQTEIHLADEPARDFEVRASALLDRRQNPAGWLLTFHDISAYRQTEKALRESKDHFRSIVQTATDAIVTIDIEGKIIAWNQGAQKIFQYSEDESLGQTLTRLMPERYRNLHQTGMQRVSAGGATHIIGQSVEVHGLRKDGSEFPIELVLSYYKVNQGMFFSAIIRDITDRRQMEMALQYQITHDILTGLYNRQYYLSEIERMQKSRRFPISLLMIDVDSLKEINDVLGHHAGDELLCRTAEVLNAAFRPEDLVARVGGDEFVVVLPQTDADTAGLAVQRLKTRLNEHNQDHPAAPSLSLSIGAASGEMNGLLSEVFKQADQAMYIEKALKKAAG